MDNTKRQRLEAAGWEVGNTNDFLELSLEEANIIELKLVLSNKLKELRINQNITQSSLAALMKSNQARVAKIEAGDPSVSLDWLFRGLFCVGATNLDIAQLIIESEQSTHKKSEVSAA
jgi:hypothetical protein